MTGHVYAPNGTIHLRKGTTARGVFIGNNVMVGVTADVTLDADQPPPVGNVFAGRVLDANDASTGTDTPIVGATVSLLNTTFTTTTDISGNFSLSGVDVGVPVFEIDSTNANLAPDGSSYASFREKVTIEEGQNTVTRPFFLPRIDASSLTTVDPAQTTVVTNANIEVTLTIAANSAKNEDGTDFTGQISVSEVPRGFAPAELPEELDPGLLITIQPVGVSFNPPGQLDFPNIDQLPVGAEANQWSLDPKTGTFQIVGLGKVNSGGTTLETFFGGVRSSTWHATVPSAPPSDNKGGPSGPRVKDVCKNFGSDNEITSGSLREEHALTSYTSGNQSRFLRFIYDSVNADPQPIIGSNLLIPSAVSQVTISSSLEFNGIDQGPGVFYIPAPENSLFRQAVQVDASSLPTGVYPYRLKNTNGLTASNVSSFVSGEVLLNNQSNSPYGAGWTLDGVSKILPQSDGGILLLEGDGRSVLFGPKFEGTLGSFSNSIISTNIGQSLSEIAKADFNNDGFLDVIMTTSTASLSVDVSIALGDGLGGFLPPNNLNFPSDSLSSLVIDDFDGDGFQDFAGILFAEGIIDTLGNEDVIAVFFGDGTGSFPVQVNVPSVGPTFTNSLTSGDVNNDGVIDLILGKSGQLEVIFGDGARNFSGSIISDVGQNIVSSIKTGRFDTNNFLDLAVFASDPNPTLKLLVGDGLGNFIERNIDFGTLIPSQKMEVGDFNGDGFTDIAVADQSLEVVGIFRNDGQGGFLDPDLFPSDGSSVDLVAGDFDKDGGLDLAITSFFSSSISILQGDGGGQMFPPIILERLDMTPLNEVVGDFDNDGNLDIAFINNLPGGGSGPVGGPIEVAVLLANPDNTNPFKSPPGELSTLVENLDGSFTRTLKKGTKINFDAQGLQSSIVDRNGNTTSFSYDSNDLLTTITDPYGLVTTLTYSNGLLQNVLDPAGRTTQFAHDGNGDLITITDPDTSTRQFGYDSRHHLTLQTSKRGFDNTYEYNFAGRNIRSNRPDGSILNVNAKDLFGLVDPASGLGTPTSPAPFVLVADIKPFFINGIGGKTEFVLNEFGNTIGTKDPLGRETIGESNVNGDSNTSTRPNGSTTTKVFNSRGNLLTSTEDSISATTTFTYENTFNQVTSITDPEGNPSTLNYDANGNLIETIDAQGTRATLAYADANCPGLATSVTSAVGLPEQNVLTNQYDASTCNLTQVTDPLLNATLFEYNTAGSATKITDAENRVTRFEYNVMNQVVKSIDATNSDPTPVCGTAGVTCFNYDAAGNLLDVTDANGNVTAFEYGPLDRTIKRTDPLGLFETASYDGNGNLRFITDRNLQTIEFQYDLANQLVNKILQPGTAEEEIITQAYDQLGDVTSVVDADSALTFTYDLIGRLASASTDGSSSQPNSLLNYTLDKNGNRKTLADNSFGTTSYVYDNLNRLTSLTNPASQAFTFGYDVLSRKTSTILPNGTTTDLAFDAASQLTSLVHQEGVNPLSSFGYTYDKVGNRTSLTTARPITGISTNLSYVYDELDQVTQATRPLAAQPDETFNYDPVGNRLNRDGQVGNSAFNGANHLAADAEFTYAYDSNGNTTSKTNTSTSEVTQYTWNAENRLIGITTPTSTVTYKYDGLGRRIQKDVDGVITAYIYDQEDILFELDDLNNVLARYTHGLGIDEPLVMARGGASFFYHADGLGSITELTDAAGATAQGYLYDSFGGIQSIFPTFQNPYTFTSREFDPESGLYYYRARYYDSNSGRFLTEDPIGFAGLDTNLYRYVFNNPANFTDPNGKFVQIGVLIALGEAALASATVLTFREEIKQAARNRVEFINDIAQKLRDIIFSKDGENPRSEDPQVQQKEINDRFDRNKGRRFVDKRKKRFQKSKQNSQIDLNNIAAENNLKKR